MLKVYHIRHDFVILQNENADIFIDPFKFNPLDIKIKDSTTPNYVFFTHEHFDHFDIKAVFILAQTDPDLKIIMPKSMADKVADLLKYGVHTDNITLVEPNKFYSLNHFNVYTVPAYNINKFKAPNEPYHPKDKNWVGYIFQLDKAYPSNQVFINSSFIKELRPLNVRTIMHTGDSDNIPEYKHLPIKVDMLFVPVSGTYVMTWQEALQATKTINPQIAIPMHYGEIVGTEQDAQNFVHG